MKLFLLIVAVLALFGCGGDSASRLSYARFVGTYSGTWVNTADETDRGTATYTFSPDGTLTGQEFGPSGAPSGNVAGRIDPLGHLSSVLTEATEASEFDGALALDGWGIYRAR
ncbi:hypothetical protein [Fimbriimonas ginsengisoli]|uniref:Uncharacterized protein n=1 Tax=Fimbriimonas ginsengisoli Gsoil 348 TaxID=661478 RepID=A0A068NTF9_FIMGI|nr:hypothetical protein [Fimbriimonas ginsengisoli]AIE86726.1 hypothetical protein OP10G_3358 [Fimbriimonas ginsengisoli Gsoil 348]